MKLLIQSALLCTLFLASASLFAEPQKIEAPTKTQAAAEKTQVLMSTSEGDIVIEVYEELAPVTAKNFLDYVNNGFYDGIIFHRVIPGFVIQGGGFDAKHERRTTNAPIINESNAKLKNRRGTLSMARTNDPDSATTQFFINLIDNISLNWTPARPGYAVFGAVVSGMDVVDSIANAPQGKHAGRFSNAPNKPVTITKASVIPKAEPEAKTAAKEPEKAQEAKTEPTTKKAQ